MSGKWKIEHRLASGWDDAGWTDRFETKKAAEAAIDEFISDTASAFRAGYLAEAYLRRDYRAVKEDEKQK